MVNKIKKEQLTKIQESQASLTELLNQIGYAEATKHGLLHEFARVNKEVEDFKSELESEYGPININVEDGTFTKVEEVKAD